MRFVVVLALIGCKGDEGTDKPGNPDDGCVVEVPYDGIDQDCDGGDLVDVDEDGDDAVSSGGTDCDDEDPTIHPGATDVPYDGIDQDCADGDLLDADGDGDLPLTEGGTDCDDDDALTHPGATDTVGNGVDNDCDGVDGVDGDQDGFASKDSAGTDCNDTDFAVNPGAAEIWYDGLDQNCDRVCDFDQDNDGAVAPGYPIPNGSPCDTAPGPETYAPEDCNELDPQVNDVTVGRLSPESGAREVPVDTSVYVALSEADPAPSLVVVDTTTGLEVPGTSTVGADNIDWQPSGLLAAGTAHRIDVTHGCGTESFTFTTAYEVVPVEAGALLGRVWSVDVGNGIWTEPEDVADLFASFLSSSLMVEVVGTTVDTLDLRLATHDVVQQQELCTATADTVADYSGNPEIAFGPVTWPLNVDLATVDLLDATVTAGVRGGGTVLADFTIAATLDTRPMVDPFLGGGPPEAMCDLVGAFGTVCIECPDGTGAFCLPVRIEGIDGTEMAGPIVPRTPDDVAADPNCP